MIMSKARFEYERDDVMLHMLTTRNMDQSDKAFHIFISHSLSLLP